MIIVFRSRTSKGEYHQVDLENLSCTCKAGMNNKICWAIRKAMNAEINTEPAFNPDLWKRQREPREYTGLTAWRNEELWSW
jgi:hypothetical protein